MKKTRLDILLVEKGLVESRTLAQKMIMAGEILIDGQAEFKPSQVYDDSISIELKSKPPFVSRGGEKLLKGLQEFSLTDLTGKICVDIGASTGGFTDCLLQHGAERVYAVDVGYGQLHDKLRKNQRVIVMERTNVRNIQSFPDEVDLITVDASFISLKTILPVIKTWSKGKQYDVIALVKPQFEVGRELAARGRGVIRDESIRKEVVEDILTFARKERFKVQGMTESPLLGPKGNKEYLIHLRFNV